MLTRHEHIACGECGNEIAGESTGIDSAQRQPCPQCGSTARSFSINLETTITVSDTVRDVLITYPQTLLTTAGSFLMQGHFDIAIIVSHMACEIAVERSISEAFIKKGVPGLRESVIALFSGYNLANDKIRKLYTALTSDNIVVQPFWQDFNESSVRRSKIMHAGVRANKTEATDSVAAASDLISHLKK